MKRTFAIGLFALMLAQAGIGQTGLELTDLVRLAEAFRLAGAVQAKLWPGWETAPFPVLLVTPAREFLARSVGVPSGFGREGYSGILQAELWSRSRQFDPGLLATFPAFGPPATIVIGTAEATKKRSAEWVLTVLHEHFHQYQMSDPVYFSAVRDLGLSGGDETGMWMLNYPFPYKSDAAAKNFAAMSRQLADALTRPSEEGRRRFWRTYAGFLGTLSEPDSRYLSFQVWQEGIARYVELRVAEIAADAYAPTTDFRSLPDFDEFAAVHARMRGEILRQLASPDLAGQQRVSFYAFGAGLALLLDQEGNAWKGKYLADKFFVEKYSSCFNSC